MADLQLLADELTLDPLGRGYASMTDQQATDSLNAVDRPGVADPIEVLNTILLSRHRSNNGTDTGQSNIYGRLDAMAGATVGTDVFGQGNLPQQAQNATAEDIHSAKTFLFMIMHPETFPLNTRDADITPILGDLVRAEVMGGADRTAIQALSDNKQSRAAEVGIGPVILGDVVAARAL